MITSRPANEGWELVKWLLVTLLAAMLALTLISRVAGADGPSGEPPPDLLSAVVVQEAVPMDTGRIESQGGDSGTGVTGDAASADVALARRLQSVLEAHRTGDIDAAIEGWLELRLPLENEAWRHVALADAYLEKGQLADMAGSLDESFRYDPDNAVAHYYVALLRLEQAATARLWYDAVGRPAWQLVSFPPMDVAPNTSAMYRLVASYELEKAIDSAVLVPWERYLAPVDCTSPDAEFGPTVDDLLVSIGADRFEGDSHHMLGDVYLARGSLGHAEEHFDEAAALGTHVVFGYMDLGRLYEERGRHLDAACAYGKQVRQGHDVVVPTQKLIENFCDALGDLW